MPTPTPAKPKARRPLAKRRNVYFRSPILFAALQQACAMKLIQAKSPSERIEQWLETEARRILPKLAKAGAHITPELKAFLKGE